MSCPDEYWGKVAKAVETRRGTDLVRSGMVRMGWIRQSTAMGALSSRKYAARIRADGKVLCLKCRKYRHPNFFWIIAGGTFLNKCKLCRNRSPKK